MKNYFKLILISLLINATAHPLNIQTDKMCSKPSQLYNKFDDLYKIYDSDLYKNFYDVLSLKKFPRNQIPMFFCISKLESNFNSKALNLNKNGTIDAGLFQINEIWKEKCHYKLYTTEDNIDCALIIYNEQGLDAWTTYKKYKNTCLNSINKYIETEKNKIESIANN